MGERSPAGQKGCCDGRVQPGVLQAYFVVQQPVLVAASTRLQRQYELEPGNDAERCESRRSRPP